MLQRFSQKSFIIQKIQIYKWLFVEPIKNFVDSKKKRTNFING